MPCPRFWGSTKARASVPHRLRRLCMQMRWMRRNKFRVGRNFFGWAVENGTVYVAGGRIDSRSLRCSADVRCLQAERIVRGCDSPCDALNAADDDSAAKPTPWRLVGRLPAAMCVFAHCVVTLPTAADQPAVAPLSGVAVSTATSRAQAAHSTSTERC